jgi:hypothetical protein
LLCPICSFGQKGIFFITRQKDNAVYTSTAEKILTATCRTNCSKTNSSSRNIKDENGIGQRLKLRRIAWWDGAGKRVYGFITNNFKLDAATIAGIYRYRWQIELFFKKLKQNMQLQYFAGDNQNAIEIRLRCTLIAVLLLTVAQQSNK